MRGSVRATQYSNELSQKDGLPECYVCSERIAGVECEFSPSDTDVCKGYRLPTEAEWEYAARAGTTTAFYSGGISNTGANCASDANLDGIAWYCRNAEDGPREVMKKEANAWGLFDMSGNVTEWTSDGYTADLTKASTVDPVIDWATTEFPGSRAVRGGYYKTSARFCRSAVRSSAMAANGYEHIGFRVVVAPQ